MEKAKTIEELVKVIVENVGSGQSVRYDLKTLSYGVVLDLMDIGGWEYLEMKELPDNLEEELQDWELETIIEQRSILALPDEIDPPRSWLQFEWMRNFADENSTGKKFDRDVERALKSRHPFGAYKDALWQHGLLDDWYKYRDECCEKYVREELGLDSEPIPVEDMIEDELARIEDENDITILLAVESGSRAWGFASPDSDYDVRFIYVHKPEWYFSVANQPDTIEYMSEDHLLDFSGWELRKTLRLLAKTNPNLSDWLLTDMTYLSDETFLKEIRKAQADFYNPINAMYHFFNIAKHHDEGYLRRNGCTLKKFLYFLRGVLACEYIEKHKKHPPVDFRKLVEATVADNNLKKSIYRLLDLKTQSKESDARIVEEELQQFAYSLYNTREKKLGEFRPVPNEHRWSELDAILYRYAAGKGESAP